MFRMANPAAYQQKMIHSLIPLTMVLCLVTHFLMEDFSPPQAVDSTAKTRSTVGLALNTIEPQDDLAIAANMPQALPHTNPPAVTARRISLERQLVYPTHKPPKIV